jgi:sn-glycerol 3-phosphate transport system permease protein
MATIQETRSGQLAALRPSSLALRATGWKVLGYLTIVLLVVAVGAPLYWMAIASLKTNREIYTAPPTWIPVRPTLENFGIACRAVPFGNFFVNSVVVTALTTAAKLFNATLCGYAFAYLRFPGKQVILLIVLGALMVPEEITILPNYLTIARFGWVNSYAGLVVPACASAFGTFFLRQHFLTLPREVLEAAHVDGAGHLRTILDVVLPMSRPALITLLLLTVVQRWNDFLWPLIATNTATMRTLPIGIFFLFQQEGTTVWGAVMAGTLIVVLPVLVLYLWAQRYIVDGLASGAVKG